MTTTTKMAAEINNQSHRTTRFDCLCGESIDMETRDAGQRTMPECDCGRRYLVIWTATHAVVEED